MYLTSNGPNLGLANGVTIVVVSLVRSFYVCWNILVIAGRLILTDHALYFEALRVVSYDKAKIYDLSDDLKQVVRPELTGPWGTRIFDKAVLYKSISM